MNIKQKILAQLKRLYGLGVEFDCKYIAGYMDKYNIYIDENSFAFQDQQACYKLPEIIEVEGWIIKMMSKDGWIDIVYYKDFEEWHYKVYSLPYSKTERRNANRLLAALTIYGDLIEANKERKEG